MKSTSRIALKSTPLASVAEVIFSNVDKLSQPGEIPVRLCNYTDVYYNRVIDNHVEFKSATATQREIDRFRLRVGDVIITKDSEGPDDIAVPAYIAEDIQDLVCGYHLAILRSKSGVLEGRFLLQLLQLNHTRHYFATLANGVTRFGLSTDAIKEARILLPSFSTQQKIADILGTWDKALDKFDALIVAKDRRKQALMQQLLTGHRRLPGFRMPWKRVELSEVAEECSIRNGQTLDRTRLYAVTKADGMVPMRENVQGATINRCQIVKLGWFAYNPMRINIGSIARWESDDPVMVSPDYVVFRTKESLLLSDYLDHVRRATAWADFVGAAGNGSVRIRIWFDDLGYFELPLPPIPEQRAIATILNTADAELRILRQQRAALDHQKRGLMQQLLTGRLRVSSAST